MKTLFFALLLGIGTTAHTGHMTRAKISTSCQSCRARCHGDKACTRTCYEIKRTICEANGFGPGPTYACTCT